MAPHTQKSKPKRVKPIDSDEYSTKITKWLVASPKKPTPQNDTNEITQQCSNDNIQPDVEQLDNLVSTQPKTKTKSKKHKLLENNKKITSWIVCSPKNSVVNNEIIKSKTDKFNKTNAMVKKSKLNSSLECDDDDDTDRNKHKKRKKEKSKSQNLVSQESEEIKEKITKTSKRRRRPKVFEDYVYNKKITKWLIVTPKSKNDSNKSSKTQLETSKDENVKNKKRRFSEDEESDNLIKRSKKFKKSKSPMKKKTSKSDIECIKKDSQVAGSSTSRNNLEFNKTEENIQIDPLGKKLKKKNKNKKFIKIKQDDNVSIKNKRKIKEDEENYANIPNETIVTSTNNDLNKKKLKKSNKRKLNDENGKGTLHHYFKKSKEETEHRLKCYEKYGMNLPSFSEIKKYKKNLETYNDKVNKAMNFMQQVKINKEIKKINTASDKDVILGCDLLNPAEIEEYFEKFLPYLERIIEGSEYNWRHEKFLNGNSDELNYNTSMVTFTHQQKDQLADLCTEYFEEYPIKNHHKYYFNVLLPELCLRIFMDVHKMEYDDALEYLERRPVDDVF